MKRIVAILLAVTMIFALAACSTGSDDKASTPPSQSATPPSTPSNSGPASSSSPPSEAPTIADPFGGAGTVGFVTDEVDHWAREEYNIVYYNFQVTILTGGITDAFEKLGKAYNFKLEQLTANGNTDMYINILQTILLKEPDGIIVDVRPENAPRVSEILEDYAIPSVCLQNKPVDTTGTTLLPCVIMDQIHNGRRLVEYLDEVYTDYWGDIDKSEIMLLILDWSTNVDINLRAQGAEQMWKELYGDQPFIYGDTASGGLNAESGYATGNSIIAANPEVKYWFIVGTTEDITLGCTRAVEALGKEDSTLIAATGVSTLPGEWDAGYDGCWIAIYYVPPAMYAGPAIFGLLAMIDGRATMDDLWSEYVLPGDKAPRLTIPADVVTRENYKSYNDEVMKGFGI